MTNGAAGPNRVRRDRSDISGSRGKEAFIGFFDSAQEVLDKGVSAAKGAVSGVAVEQQAFMKGFVRLCNDGWNCRAGTSATAAT